jgi:ornithine carbamoyltransferase
MGQERETERRRLAFEGYRLDRTLLNYAATRAFVMHDLPAHRGEEITEDAIESPNSIIFDQAENRLWAQAAVVVTLLGLEDSVTG